MAWIILGLGLVLVIEGLVFALAPNRLEEALELIRNMSPEARRLAGLTAVAIGTFLVWLARWLGA